MGASRVERAANTVERASLGRGGCTLDGLECTVDDWLLFASDPDGKRNLIAGPVEWARRALSAH